MFDCLMRTQKNKHMHSHVVYSMQNKVEARERDCKPKPIVRLIDVGCEKACNRATLGRANLHLDASVCLLDVWWKKICNRAAIVTFSRLSLDSRCCVKVHIQWMSDWWRYALNILACMYVYMCVCIHMYIYNHTWMSMWINTDLVANIQVHTHMSDMAPRNENSHYDCKIDNKTHLVMKI